MNNSQNRLRSMPCPNCKRLISRNTPRCIHCGLPRPRTFVELPLLGSLVRGDIAFTDTVVMVCFALYVLALALDISGGRSGGGGGLLGLLDPSSLSLYKLGMGGWVPLQQGRWWSLLTATYLHGGLLHIGFNMLWLRQIGKLTEELFGSTRFILLYTLAGLGGSILSTVLGTAYFVGASGAVFGLFGALIYYGRSRGGVFGSNILRSMGLWAVILFVFGLVSPSVDNWGHLGGFLGGFLGGYLLGFEERQRTPLWQHVAAAITLVFIGLCFALMLVNFFLS